MFELLPAAVQLQLLLDRDPHGNVQVAKIETERLLLELVDAELAARKAAGTFHGKFNGIPHYMVCYCILWSASDTMQPPYAAMLKTLIPCDIRRVLGFRV